MAARQLIQISLAFVLILHLAPTSRPAEALKLPAFFSWMQHQHQQPSAQQVPPAPSMLPGAGMVPNLNLMNHQLSSGPQGAQQQQELADQMMTSASNLFEAGRLTTSNAGNSLPASSSLRKPFQSIQMMLPGKHNQIHLFSALPKSLFGRLLSSSSSSPSSTPSSLAGPQLGHNYTPQLANQFTTSAGSWPPSQAQAPSAQQVGGERQPVIFTGEPTNEHQHFHHLQYRQQVPKRPFAPTSGGVSNFQRPQFSREILARPGEKHALGFGETEDFVVATLGEPNGQMVRGLTLEDNQDANGGEANRSEVFAANKTVQNLPAQTQEQQPSNSTIQSEPKLATGKLQQELQQVATRQQNETISGPVTTQSPTSVTTGSGGLGATETIQPAVTNGTLASSSSSSTSSGDWSLMVQPTNLNSNSTSQGQESAESLSETREDGKMGSGPSLSATSLPTTKQPTARQNGPAETSDSLESSAAAIIVAPGEPSEGPGGELTSDEQVESFILGPYRGHHSPSNLQTPPTSSSSSSASSAAVAAHEMLPEGPNQFGRELQQLQQLMAAASGHQAAHLSHHQQATVLPPPPPPAPAQPILSTNFHHHRRPHLGSGSQLTASVVPGRLASSLIQQAKSLIQLPFVHMQQQQPFRQSPLPTREPLKSQPSIPFVSHQTMGAGLNTLPSYHHHQQRPPLFALPQHQQQQQPQVQPSKQSYFLMAPARHLAPTQQPTVSNQQQSNVPYYLAKPAALGAKLANQQQPFRLMQLDQQRQPAASQPAPSAQTSLREQRQPSPNGSKFKSGLYQIEPPKLQVAGGRAQQQQSQSQPQPQPQPQEFQQQRLVHPPELDDDNVEEQQLERKPQQPQVQQQQHQQQQQLDENDEEEEQATTERPEFARQVGASMGVASHAPANSTHSTKAGQVFNEPLGSPSSESQQQQGSSRSVSELKTLKLSQDITLYDFEQPAIGSSNQKPISFLDTQVYTLPFALPPPQQPQAQQGQRNHHFHHFRQQFHQPQAQASYLHQHQLGRFPLAYSAPPQPQLPASQYQRQQSAQPNQQHQSQAQVQAQAQAQPTSQPQRLQAQPQKAQAPNDIRSPFKALYQEFAGGPQVGGAGQVDWAPAQALGLQTFSDDSAATNELRDSSQHQQPQQHYFHYQPMGQPIHHQHQRQHQQQQGYELPTFGAHLNHLNLHQPSQQHQFVLAIQHQQHQVAPQQQTGSALFSSSSMAVAPPSGSLTNEQLVAAIGPSSSTEPNFVEAFTSAAPPPDESSTQTVQELVQPQLQVQHQQQEQPSSLVSESSNAASIGQDDDGFSAPAVSQDNNGQQRLIEARRNQQQQQQQQQQQEQQQQQQQPEQSPSLFCAGRAPGLYADETQRCRAYYQCAPTGHQMFRCNNQTQFNQKTQNCDWWYNVDCAGQVASAQQLDDGQTTASAAATTSATPSVSTVSSNQQDREAAASSDDQQHQHLGSVLDLQSEERKQLRHWSLPTPSELPSSSDQRQSGNLNSNEDLQSDLLEGGNSTTSNANGVATTATRTTTSTYGDNLNLNNDQSAGPAPTSATTSLFGGENLDQSATTSSVTTQDSGSGKPTDAPSQQSQPQVGADESSASAAALTATTSAATATTTTAASTTPSGGPEDDHSVLAQQSQQPASSSQQQQISQQASATPPSTEGGRAGGERRVVQSEFGVGVANNSNDSSNKAARSAAAAQRFEFMRSAAAAVAPNPDEQATSGGLDDSMYSMVSGNHHHHLAQSYPTTSNNIQDQTSSRTENQSQATRERPRKYERRFGERLVKV